MVEGATCPGTALLICFNLIVCQLDESINRLSLICKWCVFAKQGAESGRQGGTSDPVPPGQCGPVETPEVPVAEPGNDSLVQLMTEQGQGRKGSYSCRKVDSEIRAHRHCKILLPSKLRPMLPFVSIIFQTRFVVRV